MENITSKRDKEIEELTNFVKSTNEFLMGTLSSLGWSEERTEKNEEKLICPFNSSHRLYQKSVEKHIEDCLWKAEGYSEEDVPLSIPSVPPDASNYIKIDEQLMDDIFQLARMQCPTFRGGRGNRLIPRTSNRLLADFTSEERKVLYDYVVANTEQPDIGEDIADLNKVEKTESKKFSYLELLAQERNLKRRRAKHRGVHTNKKSHVEIMREVINQQMEMLTEHLTEKSDFQHSPEAEKKHTKDNRRDSRHESSSRRSRISSAENERNSQNGDDHISKRKSNVRRDSSNENHRHSSRSGAISRSSHEAGRHRHHHHSSSRSHDSRERKSHRHSEERKRPRKRSRDRSKEKHHKHKKHKSKSKRSRSRDEERSRKR